MSRTETPDYSVVERVGAIEIRDYPALIMAEVEATGERKAAITAGFRRLAGYIFGGNAGGQRIAMTAPVMQQAAGSGWAVRFVMPKQYPLAALPAPEDAGVRLLLSAPRRYAAIRFSGSPDAASLFRQRERLEGFLRERGLETHHEPVLAFYNPPWTLPFLRRNEILRELGDTPIHFPNTSG